MKNKDLRDAATRLADAANDFGEALERDRLKGEDAGEWSPLNSAEHWKGEYERAVKLWRTQVKVMQGEHEGQVAASREEIRDLQLKLKSAQRGAANLREGLGAMADRNEALRVDLNNARTGRDNLAGDVVATAQRAEKRVAVLENKLETAGKWTAKYRADLDSLLEEKRSLQAKVELLATDKHTLSSRIDKAILDLADVWADNIPWSSRDRIDRIVGNLKGEDR